MSLLLSLDLQGRRVVLAGGGSVSARRARSYVDEGADVVIVAPELCTELDDLVRGGLVTWMAEPVEREHLLGAWLVHTATGDLAVDLLVAEWAAAERIWCVNAGSGAEGSARSVATNRVGELTIGVSSTTGADPRRTKGIGDALAEFNSAF